MSDNLGKNIKAKAYICNIDMCLKAYELAQAKGKKPEDSIEEELTEIARANPDQFNIIE